MLTWIQHLVTFFFRYPSQAENDETTHLIADYDASLTRDAEMSTGATENSQARGSNLTDEFTPTTRRRRNSKRNRRKRSNSSKNRSSYPYCIQDRFTHPIPEVTRREATGDLVLYNETFAQQQIRRYRIVCMKCKKEGFSIDTTCPNCKMVTYCSQDCRSKDIGRHKKMCERISKLLEAKEQCKSFCELTGCTNISLFLRPLADNEMSRATGSRTCVLTEMVGPCVFPDVGVTVRDVINQTRTFPIPFQWSLEYLTKICTVVKPGNYMAIPNERGVMVNLGTGLQLCHCVVNDASISFPAFIKFFILLIIRWAIEKIVSNSKLLFATICLLLLVCIRLVISILMSGMIYMYILKMKDCFPWEILFPYF